MPNRTPSFTHILRTDYFASATFWFPIVGWIILGVFLILFRPQDYFSADASCCYCEDCHPEIVAASLLFAIVALTLLALLALLWRYRMIHSIFKKGVKVAAIVSNAWLYGSRLRLDYIYMSQGHKYATSNVVYKNNLTPSLEVGRKITVVLDPQNPKHAFVYETYFAAEPFLPGIMMEGVSQPVWAEGQSLSQPNGTVPEAIPEIEFRGQYNKTLYYKTIILASIPSKRAAVIRLLLLVGFALLCLNAITVNAEMSRDFLSVASIMLAVFVFLVMGYVLLLPYTLAWRAAVISWQETKTQAPLAGKVTEQGIAYHSPFSNEEFKWEEFAAVRKFQDVLTLVTDDARLSGHAASFFSNGEDWERFQQIVACKVIEAK